ncbi:MAG: GIY-YIG nuclease family protein [Euryarchaeota archaeon]|nr:GIY-YIG nuclease family protein [Euryarchaeota archaeon]
MTIKGTYVLILRMNNDTDIIVGKLRGLKFKKGFYAYIGSALGTGGFKRVTRHFNVASGKNHVRKWHIDYLLPQTDVICAVLLPTYVALECTIAEKFSELFKEITGFGCTDCACRSHLFFSGTNPENKVAEICDKVTGIESIILRPDI